jgi:hypothetical protein
VSAFPFPSATTSTRFLIAAVVLGTTTESGPWPIRAQAFRGLVRVVDEANSQIVSITTARKIEAREYAPNPPIAYITEAAPFIDKTRRCQRVDANALGMRRMMSPEALTRHHTTIEPIRSDTPQNVTERVAPSVCCK